ncbi:MAG: DUF2157 domain-containing protein [Candidatus Peregrinibacteria bacterium]|nr:DUF2157 domain-containing protein [Candidatus Peregrinibacteria bacterium]
MNVDQALAHWQDEGLLTEKKAQELRKSIQSGSGEIPHRAISIFSAVGAILIGLGVILFIASNWQEMLPVVKVALLLLGMISTAIAGYYLAFENRAFEKTGLALLFVNVFIYGASIFLIGQIYHLPLTFWWGALLWFLGTAIFAYVLRSKLHLWLAVPLLLLFLGWLRSYATSGFFSELDFLFDNRRSILTILPIIGMGLMSLGVLHRRAKGLSFGSTTLFHWGIFLIILPVVVSTADESVFYGFFRFATDPVAIVVTLVSLALFLLAVGFGVFQTKQGVWALLALVLYVAYLFIVTRVPEWLGYPLGSDGLSFYLLNGTNGTLFTAFFVMHILLSFVFLLTVIWYGTILHMTPVVNMGMLGVAAAIIVQYFSWVFALFDRSLAFIIGGILILALTMTLERKRRQILTTMRR